uniref:Uncharacterized protein n=1 Tax=Meloidogyne enterolobii TaxID=390850 RepID=A0A6V7W2T8_MELEN|nr:unnamed protein product [Meloidogyne enterolobii]
MSIIPPLCNPVHASLVGSQLDKNNISSTGNAKINAGTPTILQESEKAAAMFIPKTLGQTNFEKLLKDKCFSSMNISAKTAAGFFSNFEPPKIMNFSNMHNH